MGWITPIDVLFRTEIASILLIFLRTHRLAKSQQGKLIQRRESGFNILFSWKLAPYTVKKKKKNKNYLMLKLNAKLVKAFFSVLPCRKPPPEPPSGGWSTYLFNFNRYQCPNGYDFENHTTSLHWYISCTAERIWEPYYLLPCRGRIFIHSSRKYISLNLEILQLGNAIPIRQSMIEVFSWIGSRAIGVWARPYPSSVHSARGPKIFREVSSYSVLNVAK